MNRKRTFQELLDEQKLLQIGNEQAAKLGITKPTKEQLNNFNVDTQVTVKKQKAPKRQFTNAYKLQILNAFDACKNSHERGALLRKEGLYSSRISTWKNQFQDGQFISKKTPKSLLLTQQLTREVSSLKKKLLQAEAIIDLQKKISELLSINTQGHDGSEM